MKEKKIVGIGEIVWDMLPTGKQLGGAPLNFAYMAKELGATSYAISAIGNDELGDETFAKLTGLGVNISALQTNNLPTGQVLVKIEGEGIPHYDILENVAWDAIECSQKELDIVSEADAICWGSLAQRSEESKLSILRMLDEASPGCLKVFDINIRQHYGRKEIIELLRQRSRPYLFSNSLAPSIVGASLKVFEMLSKDTSLRDKLENNTIYFKEKMMTAGFDIVKGDSAIVPIMLYDAKLAQQMARLLLNEGIYVIGFFFPVVPKGKARIRVQLSAAHSIDNIDKAVNAFTKIGKMLNII